MRTPFRGVLECQVRYTPAEIESWLRRALIHREAGKDIGPRLAQTGGGRVRYAIQTSQAVDIIRGGSKDNQLPDNVFVLMNYRVAPHDSAAGIKQSVRKLLQPIAKKHGLAVRGFRAAANNTDAGVLVLQSREELSPAPISPTGHHDKVWQLFGGTIRTVFEDHEC